MTSTIHHEQGNPSATGGMVRLETVSDGASGFTRLALASTLTEVAGRRHP